MQWPPGFVLGSAMRVEVVLGGRDPLEARTQSGAASASPECAQDFLIDIHYRSGFPCHENWTLTSNRHRQGATGPALYMTKSGRNPKYRRQRSHIECEPIQPRCYASGLPKRQPQLTAAFPQGSSLGQASCSSSLSFAAETRSAPGLLKLVLGQC